MEMPKPTDAHRKLEKLVGTWKGEERMHPSPWDPMGGKSVGHVHNRASLDGFIVLHDYVQERGGTVTFQGHGVFAWDSSQQCYVLHWWDTMGVPVNIFRGQFEGDTLVMTTEDPQMSSRVVWKFGPRGRYDFQMDVSKDGIDWQTSMDGRYRRAGAAAAKKKPARRAKAAGKRTAARRPTKKAKRVSGKGSKRARGR